MLTKFYRASKGIFQDSQEGDLEFQEGDFLQHILTSYKYILSNSNDRCGRAGFDLVIGVNPIKSGGLVSMH